MKQAVCYTHFHSNKVFRGDHNLKPSRMRGTSKEYSRKIHITKGIVVPHTQDHTLTNNKGL